MKEVKAYVRPERVFEVIHHLEAAGARDMTVIEVKAIGGLVDARAVRHLVRKYAEKYSAITKLEIVCRDDEAGRFARIVVEHARTGASGDGRVFVSTIDTAVRIRDGVRGEEAL